MTDLVAELPARVEVPEPLRRRVAVHEAGHAVLAVVLQSGEIISLSVQRQVSSDARGVLDGGGFVLRDEALAERTRDQLLDRVATLLGGLAAEEVVLGQRSAGGGGGKGSDLHAATMLALSLEASYGLGESLAYLASSNEEDLFTALRLDRLLQGRVVSDVPAPPFALGREGRCSKPLRASTYADFRVYA